MHKDERYDTEDQRTDDRELEWAGWVHRRGGLRSQTARCRRGWPNAQLCSQHEEFDSRTGRAPPGLRVGMLNGNRCVLSGAVIFFIGYLAFCMQVAVFLSGISLQERGSWVAMSVSCFLMAALATVLILPSVRLRAIARRLTEWERLDTVAVAAGEVRSPAEVSKRVEGA